MSVDADLLSIGLHCSVTWCKQLDFLPFNCSHCKHVFCLEHRTTESHQCEAVKEKDVYVPICPLCGELIKKAQYEELNIQVEKHLLSGCKDLVLRKPKKSNKCSLKGCRQNELLPFYCNQCGRKYCVRHRHAQDHSCTVLSVPLVACS